MTKTNKEVAEVSMIRRACMLLIGAVAVFYSIPWEISQKEWTLYAQSYGVTMGLTVGGVIIGTTLGVVFAFIRYKKIPILTDIVEEYIDIMRGTPMLLQLLIFSLVVFSSWRNSFLIATITLGLNSAAYVAELVRSGLESVDKGQMEAARAIGMPFGMAMKEVVLPQGIKNILPALASEFITLFKETSVVGYISVRDLTMASKGLQAAYYSPKPVIFTGIIYYISVKFFSYLSRKLERKLREND